MLLSSLILVVLTLFMMDDFIRKPQPLRCFSLSHQCDTNLIEGNTKLSESVEPASTGPGSMQDHLLTKAKAGIQMLPPLKRPIVPSTAASSSQPSQPRPKSTALESTLVPSKPEPILSQQKLNEPETSQPKQTESNQKQDPNLPSMPASSEIEGGAVKTEPMVLSIDYWEQTGNALQNLFDLQCWASTVGIEKVVEPSIKIFGTGVFHIVHDGKGFTFKDLFDINHWNSMSQRYTASPLVTFQHFLEHAARNVVYVQITCGPEEHSVRCHPLSSVARNDWAKFLHSRGFSFVKTVCLDFITKTSMTEELFREKIFKGTDGPVTVIFDEFKGIRQYGKPVRMILTGPMCGVCVNKLLNFDPISEPVPVEYRPWNSSSQIVSSQRIVKYVNRFISKWLSGERYIAVMLRTEKLKTVLKRTPDNDTCASNIISDWKEMATKKNIHKTLFFSDIGRHGSYGWRKDPTASRFSRHIHDALNLEFSLDKINSIFEKMTRSKDSVQIALLQRELVTRASCVVVVGGGIFQAQALNMYFHKHRGHECYSYRDKQCQSSYIKRIYGL